MDFEEENSVLNFRDKISSIFSEFMLRIAKFDELVGLAHQFLIGYRQALETFLRPQLYKTSDFVGDIIEAILTDRMKAYVEAGSRDRHNDVQNIIKLTLCRQGLQDHLVKVKILLDELRLLKEDAIVIAMTEDHNAPMFLDKYDVDVLRHESLGLDEEITEEPVHLQDKSISHAILISVIYNMFSFDYIMQENVINSINSASSEELESYCFMWDVRPYINNNVMRRGWALVSS